MNGWKRSVLIAFVLATVACDHTVQGVPVTEEELATSTAKAMVLAVTEEYARLTGGEALPFGIVPGSWNRLNEPHLAMGLSYLAAESSSDAAVWWLDFDRDSFVLGEEHNPRGVPLDYHAMAFVEVFDIRADRCCRLVGVWLDRTERGWAVTGAFEGGAAHESEAGREERLATPQGALPWFKRRENYFPL